MFFFFNDTATTEIYTLSLHDALPISEIYAAVVDDVEWLVEQGCKLIVLACNSATIAVIAPLRDRFPSVPIIGVVPAIKPAAARTKSGTVAVFATETTVRSDYYAALKAEFAADVAVLDRAAPEDRK